MAGFFHLACSNQCITHIEQDNNPGSDIGIPRISGKGQIVIIKRAVGPAFQIRYTNIGQHIYAVFAVVQFIERLIRFPVVFQGLVHIAAGNIHMTDSHVAHTEYEGVLQGLGNPDGLEEAILGFGEFATVPEDIGVKSHVVRPVFDNIGPLHQTYCSGYIDFCCGNMTTCIAVPAHVVQYPDHCGGIGPVFFLFVQPADNTECRVGHAHRSNGIGANVPDFQIK